MVSFNFKEKLTKEERKKKYLDSDYASILTHKQDKLEKTLEEGISSFHDVDLSKSAKKFRKIANDLKKMEFLISHEGNYSDRNKLNDLTGKQWLRHTKSWVIFDGK